MQKTGHYFMSRYSVITKEQNKDMGLVLILISILCFFHFENILLIKLSLTVVVISLLLPALFKPLSCLWFCFSDLLGMIMSRVMLTVVFFLVISPIGMMRRLFSKKRMLSERWKIDQESVFTTRDKIFTGKDMLNPY